MDGKEFASIRKRLNKTQKQTAELLGCSVKAVHSYEQGWRPVPPHIERQVMFLACKITDNKKNLRPCWEVMQCSLEEREQCPAWEFQAGTLCWFINGTICRGEVQKAWKDKIQICRSCEVLASRL